jgi:hypothetical protein
MTEKNYGQEKTAVVKDNPVTLPICPPPSWTAHVLNKGPRGFMPATNPLDFVMALHIAILFRIRILY